MATQDLSTLNETSLRLLKENTTITASGPGSTAEGLVRAINTTAYRMLLKLKDGELASYVSQATGSDLDKFGEVLGVDRTDAVMAQDLSYENFRFYLDPALGTGYFGNLIGRINTHFAVADQITNGILTFPTGITVYSSENSDIQYRTLAAGSMTSDSTEVYVPIQAVGVGTGYNVAANQLDTWEDISGSPYLKFARGAVLCGNKQDISSGSNQLSDKEYRYILSNRVVAAANANMTALRIAALSVPGVSDVIIRKWTHGIGTVTIFPISAATIIQTGILNAVRQAVDTVASAGVRIYTMAPTYIGIQLRLDLNFKLTTAAAERSRIVNDIRTKIVNHINNIPIGGELIITDLVVLAKNASGEVRDAQLVSLLAGELNTNTFQIQRPDPLIHTNQILRYNEKFYTNNTFVSVCEVN